MMWDAQKLQMFGEKDLDKKLPNLGHICSVDTCGLIDGLLCSI